MFHLLADFLRAEGWQQWGVVQLEGLESLIWLVFRNQQDYPAVVGKLTRPGARKDHALLEASALEKLAPAREKLGIPRVFLQRSLPAGGSLVVESGIPGRAWSDRFSSQFPAQLAKAAAWLDEFQRALPPAGTAAGSLEQSILRCRQVLADLSAEEKELLAAGEKWREALTAAPAAPVHGDFWPRNILEHQGRLSVIDWSNFHFGAPTEDLHNFVSAAATHLRGTPEESAGRLWNSFFGDSPLATLGRKAALQILDRWKVHAEAGGAVFALFLISRLSMSEFKNHAAWRVFASRYVRAGMPSPW